MINKVYTVVYISGYQGLQLVNLGYTHVVYCLSKISSSTRVYLRHITPLYTIW